MVYYRHEASAGKYCKKGNRNPGFESYETGGDNHHFGSGSA